MSLFERIISAPTTTDPEPIGLEEFWGAIVDYMAGETTANEIKIGFKMDAQEQSDLDLMLAAIDALTGLDDKLSYALQLQAVLYMAAGGKKYADQASFRTRMGL